MPEIASSPDFGANIDRLLTERFMVLQAWGAYGILWPVVAQQLGVSPDLGRGRVDVIPQVPNGQHSVAGSAIRLGTVAIDVRATSVDSPYTTTVTGRLGARLRLGVALPNGARVGSVRLDGRAADFSSIHNQRGMHVLVDAGHADTRTGSW